MGCPLATPKPNPTWVSGSSSRGITVEDTGTITWNVLKSRKGNYIISFITLSAVPASLSMLYKVGPAMAEAMRAAKMNRCISTPSLLISAIKQTYGGKWIMAITSSAGFCFKRDPAAKWIGAHICTVVGLKWSVGRAATMVVSLRQWWLSLKEVDLVWWSHLAAVILISWMVGGLVWSGKKTATLVISLSWSGGPQLVWWAIHKFGDIAQFLSSWHLD